MAIGQCGRKGKASIATAQPPQSTIEHCLAPLTAKVYIGGGSQENAGALRVAHLQQSKSAAETCGAADKCNIQTNTLQHPGAACRRKVALQISHSIKDSMHVPASSRLAQRGKQLHHSLLQCHCMRPAALHPAAVKTQGRQLTRPCATASKHQTKNSMKAACLRTHR